MAGQEFDVLIVGAGLAGCSLACALRGSRLRVCLLERQPPQLAAGWDTRIYALSPASIAFLQVCGAWEHLDSERIQVVERMDVAGDAEGHLQFSAYDLGMDALAWIVESNRIALELWETARRQPNIQVICPVAPQGVAVEADKAHLTLSDGRVLSAAVVVAADGAHSWVRQQAGIVAQIQPYGDAGVVANFSCKKAHHGTAFQWFRRDGVLAYLPLPGNQISIVWSTPQAEADAMLALAPESFAQRVAAASGFRLGELALLGEATAFPLRLMKVDEIVRPRLALIGDAAHAIHPLSGHGINLGFQDARVLAEELLKLPAFRDVGDLSVLKRYARMRAEETMIVRNVTDGLYRLFKPESKVLFLLRNAGMNLTNHVPGLRGVLTRYAAGLF